MLILAMALFVKWRFAGSSQRERLYGKTALDIPKERYARGEIGKDELEKKKRNLGG